jgi:hypothetical protein
VAGWKPLGKGLAVRGEGKGKGKGGWERAVVQVNGTGSTGSVVVSKTWSGSELAQSGSRLVAKPMKASSYFWLQLSSQLAWLSSKSA